MDEFTIVDKYNVNERKFLRFCRVKFQTSNWRDEMKNTSEKQTPNVFYLPKNNHVYTQEGLNLARWKNDVFTCIYMLIDRHF
jgi:hypothetical protein